MDGFLDCMQERKQGDKKELPANQGKEIAGEALSADIVLPKNEAYSRMGARDLSANGVGGSANGEDDEILSKLKVFVEQPPQMATPGRPLPPRLVTPISPLPPMFHSLQTAPAAATAVYALPLPPGWKAGMDQTGKEYYYNKEPNISQWVHPTAADNQSTPTSTIFVSQQQRMNDRLPTPIIVSGPPQGNASINGKRLGLQESTGVSTGPDPFGCRQKDRGWNVRVWEYMDADTGEFPSFDRETNSFKDIDELLVTHKTSTEIMYEDYEWTQIVGAPEYFFAAICSGSLRVCKAGVYTFRTESDDGSELFVDNQRIVENGGLHKRQKREGKLELSSDFHFILVKFFQCEGGATLKVTYRGPDTVGKWQSVRLDIASDPLWNSPLQLQAIIERSPKAAQEPDPDGRLPLHWATVSGSAAGVETLLNAFPEAAGMADNVGRLPLHVAAESNPNKEVIEVLLKKFPAAASMQDHDDSLPYQVAEKENNQAVSEILLKAAGWAPILIDAEMSGFIGTRDDKILQDALRSSGTGHVYTSALLRDRPLMASLYLSNVLARFSQSQRSVDMEVASKSDDLAVALEQLATFVARDLISWCSLFRKFEGCSVPGDEKCATVVLDSGLEYSSSHWNGDDSFSGELDCDTNLNSAWRSQHNNHDQYFQMDVGRVTKIRGVVTRGDKGAKSWVTTYQIKFSSDLKKWQSVPSRGEQQKEVVKRTEGLSKETKDDAEVSWQNDDGAEVKFVRPFCSLEDSFPLVYKRDVQRLEGANGGRSSLLSEGYNSGEEGKFCCGRELPETKGQCGPQSQCESCKQLQNTLFPGNSDADTPVSLTFDQHVEARYVRIIPQTWRGDICMRAGLLIDTPGYLEKEVDEALEFMADNKLKTILSDAVCVKIVMEKWNGRPWTIFWERFETIVGTTSEFLGFLWTRMGDDKDSNLCEKILGYIARIMVGVICFVIFLPFVLGFIIIGLTGPYSVFYDEDHHGGVKILATVVLLLSALLVVPYLIVGALLVGPIAFFSVSWPPSWRFLLHKTAYIGFCVIIWYLPRLEEEDIGAEAKNLGLEVAAAVLLASFIWDESAQLIRICIKSFSRGVTAADLNAKIKHAEQLVDRAKAKQKNSVSDHEKKVDKIFQKLFSKDGLSNNDAQILAMLDDKDNVYAAIVNPLKDAQNVFCHQDFESDKLRKDATEKIETITNNAIREVANICNSVSTILERKNAAKKLESEIKLLKEFKTKKTHDLAFGEKELEKARRARTQFDKQNNWFKRLNDFLHSLTDIMLWYTNDIWNCIDFVSHFVALAAGVTRGCLYAGVSYISNLEPTAVAQLHMWAVLLLWARLVSILHVSSFLGPLLHIVEVMLTKDVPQFLILCLLMMVPFVGSLSHRFGDDCSVESKTCEDLKIQDFKGFGSAGWSFLKMFADAGKGAPLDLVDGSWGPQEIFILFAAYILLLIALVNLLIAQFSKTFDTVFENSTKEYLLRRAELLMEWKDIPPYPPPFNVVASLWRAAAWLLSHLWRAAASLSHYCTGTDPFDQEWSYWMQVDCPGARDSRGAEKEKSSVKDKLQSQFEKDKLHCKCSKDHPLKMVIRIDMKNDGDEEHTWYCDVCYKSYNSNNESRLNCDLHGECNYYLCKVCAKEIVETVKKQKKVELKFNYKSLVPQSAHELWRKSLLEDFEENAEFGSEAQMEKFKGIMLEVKNTTQMKLQNLDKKIEGIESKMEGIENLLKEVAQKLN